MGFLGAPTTPMAHEVPTQQFVGFAGVELVWSGSRGLLTRRVAPHHLTRGLGREMGLLGGDDRLWPQEDPACEHGSHWA